MYKICYKKVSTEIKLILIFLIQPSQNILVAGDFATFNEISAACFTPEIKEAHNSFFGIGVNLFKSISCMEGLLWFPSYYITFSTYDQILCFGRFPSNRYYQ